MGIVEQGAMGLIPDALKDVFRRSPPADHQRVSLQARKVGGIGRQSAPVEMITRVRLDNSSTSWASSWRKAASPFFAKKFQ